ncbi:MAG TPA: DUF2786 domain-containing protein [Kaistia sp.]|nr:DUF2786 domain-containing protein [Kaistia sp.]
MSSPDLAKLRAKLAALRAKTTENGCTEAEAIAAAEKAAELMEAHNLTEVDLDAPSFDEAAVPMAGRRSPLDTIWPSVARFAHCTGYLDRVGNRWRFVYFGRAADVLVAEYVHEVIRRAADGATTAFKETDAYRRRRTTKTRIRALKAFAEGFAASISVKLRAGLWRRLEARAPGTAALVVQKNDAALRSELMRRGMQFGKADPVAASKGRFRDAARASGYWAGREISIEASVTSRPEAVAGLLT